MINLYNSKISAMGAYLPRNVVTNADLAKTVETSDEWISERTGIKERRIASPDGGEFNSDMGVEAAKQALERADISPEDIELIIYATISADYKCFPSNSAILQNKLGIKSECPCMDLGAACTGFIYGLVVADSLIKCGTYTNILVIGAEMLSSLVNWEDRATCILFSDGAGAAVVSRSEQPNLLSSVISCDGSGYELLKIPAGGTMTPSTVESVTQKKETIEMEGRPIFKYATRTMIRNSLSALEKANLTINDIDWVIPHQANLRIIEYIGKKLEVNLSKVIVTVDKYGNNSAATIPIAMNEAIQDGRIKRGDKLLLMAFGAGVTSGAMVIQY